MFHACLHPRTSPTRREEDDEFEEFKEEGACDAPCPARPPPAPALRSHSPAFPLSRPAAPLSEWGDDKKNFKAAAEDWANDWDDEETDTDFDKVLRAELDAAKAAAASAAAGGGGAAQGGGASGK